MADPKHSLEDVVNYVLYNTEDPNSPILGQPVLALTTVLYRVCLKDMETFDEAVRLITLFVKKAIEFTEKQNATDLPKVDRPEGSSGQS